MLTRMNVISLAMAAGLFLWALADNGGCVSQGGGGGTTQPVIDSTAAKFFAELALDDAILVAGSDPKLKPYVDAALKVKADLESADSNLPNYMTYIKAVNDAVVVLVIETRNSKLALKLDKPPQHLHEVPRPVIHH